MILNSGEYIRVIHRQFFPEDARRHFVGTVESHEGALVRVEVQPSERSKLSESVCRQTVIAQETPGFSKPR